MLFENLVSLPLTCTRYVMVMLQSSISLFFFLLLLCAALLACCYSTPRFLCPFAPFPSSSSSSSSSVQSALQHENSGEFQYAASTAN